MTYEQRPMRRQKIRYNSSNSDFPLVHQLVVDGEKLTPDEAPTITVYSPYSTSAVLEDEDMTLSGTLSTYSVDTTDTDDYIKGIGYRAVVTTVVSSVEYTSVLMFDVVGYPLRLSCGVDQLAARDERIAQMSYNSGEDFSEIIEATRDEMWSIIESSVIDNKKRTEDMILDESAAAVAFRLLVLRNVWQTKGKPEEAEYYDKLFGREWRRVSTSIRYDSDRDGNEDSTIGRPAIQLQW